MSEEKYVDYDPLDWKSARADAESFRDHVIELIDSALSQVNTEFITAEDRETLEWARRSFAHGYNQISSSCILPLEGARDAQAAFLYNKILSLMQGAFFAGSRGTVTASGKKFFLSPMARGGDVRGQQQMDFADKAWRNRARELFAKHRQTNTQSELAAIIKSDNRATPTERQIIGFISTLDEERRRADAPAEGGPPEYG